jgi:hypothetical protein
VSISSSGRNSLLYSGFLKTLDTSTSHTLSEIFEKQKDTASDAREILLEGAIRGDL